MPASGDEDSWFCPSTGWTMDASVQESRKGAGVHEGFPGCALLHSALENFI